MKKVLATILALIYLSSSMGATIHLHYCMGKLASWGLIDHESKHCVRCGMVKQIPSSHSYSANMDCCKDEHKQIKTVTDQQILPIVAFKCNNFSQAIKINEITLQSIEVISVSVAHPNSNAPPLLDKLPLFVLYRNFRI